MTFYNSPCMKNPLVYDDPKLPGYSREVLISELFGGSIAAVKSSLYLTM